MPELFVKYLLPTAISLIALYGVFFFFLRKETFFGWNRFFLIVSILLSFLLPFIKISTNVSYPFNNGFVHYLPTVHIFSDSLITNAHETVSQTSTTWLSYIYFAGVLLFIFRLLSGIYSIVLLIVKNKIITCDGKKLIFLHNKTSHFSFLRLIFINTSLINIQEDKEKIILHEAEHQRQKHYLDLILLEILIIVQWFNPIVWLYNRSLKNIHEYQADQAVVKAGCKKDFYLDMIYRQASGSPISIFTNQFNYLSIKNRIIMISKKKSSIWAKSKILFVCPVLLFLFVFFGVQPSGSTKPVWQINKLNSVKTENFKNGSKEIDNSITTTQLSSAQPINEQIIEPDPIQITKSQKDSIYEMVENMPSFPGGDDAMIKFIHENLKYPEDGKNKKTEGLVTVGFVINSTGRIKNIKILKSLGKSFDKEVLRVIKLMPDWTPGTTPDGKAVSVHLVIPIAFRLN